MINKKFHFINRLFATLLLMALGSATEAQSYYVFMYNSNYMTSSIGYSNSFTPNTCIWVCANALNNTTSQALYSYGNNSLYLRGTATNGNSPTTGDLQGNWRKNNNNYLLYYYSSTSYYLYYRSSAWRLSSSRDGTGDDRYSYDGTNYRATVYQVTVTPHDEHVSSPTISGVESFSALGNSTFSHETSSYTPIYTQYTFNSTNHYWYNNSDHNAAPSSSSTDITYTWALSGADGYAEVDATGKVTYTTLVPSHSLTATLTCTATHGASGASSSATKTITFINNNYPEPPIISFENTVSSGELKAKTTIQGSGNTVYYTTDGSDPTTSNTRSQYSAPFNVNNNTLVKAVTAKTVDGTTYYSSVVPLTATIQSGTISSYVILNDYEDHNWSYYSDPDSPIKSLYPRNFKITYYGYGTNTMTTNNNNPGTTNMTDVASTDVAVSKYESENTFVYYKTLERHVPITNLVEGTPGNRFPYEIIPNPFSKRPTYGNDGNSKWRGFYGWRVKSISGGKIYDSPTGGNEITANQILTTEYQKLYFQPNNNSATNANNETSMTIEFEAIWARAYRVTCAANNITGTSGVASTTLQNNVSYERNFVVVTSGTSTTNLSNTDQRPVTITMVEPDGSTDYRTTTVYYNPAYVIAQKNIKFEWMNLRVSNTLSANAKNLVVGRGVKAASGANNDNLGDMSATTTNPNPTVTAASIKGLAATTETNNTNYTNNVDYFVRIESGVSNNVFFASNDGGSRGVVSGSATLHVTGFLGNDYDRAKNDNNRLVVKNAVLEGTGANNATSGGIANNNYANALRETMVLTMKSGTTGTDFNKAIYTSDSAGFYPGPTNSFYIAIGSNARACGLRRFYMEGGSIHCLTGGMEVWNGTHTDKEYNNNKLITDIHIKHNSIIRSSAFGGPANAEHFGVRRMVYTGGQVNGWVAGACNGNLDAGGQLRGTTQLYVGGNVKVGNASHEIMVNGSQSGNVFGAGRGRATSTTTGEVSYGTNVVIADNAVILHNVYGGGDLGYALDTANVHILGGEVNGSVFGGANQKQGVNANIVVRGGLIRGGVYGGSNTKGTLSGNVTIQINGGQIGTSSTSANVHGGGFGQPTRVTGNVDITLGTCNTSGETAGTAVIYGDVYGGSALGHVNGEATSTTKHTYVTLNAGTIIGSLYGGGLGNNTTAANVYAPVTVTINGGHVKSSTSPAALGSVFGCNNTKGSPQSTVSVLMTGGEVDGSVFGGGNAAAYTGNPTVSVTGGTVHQHVFGGGLGADITGNTSVTVKGTANIKKNVYGGGSEGNVSGNTNVIIGE